METKISTFIVGLEDYTQDEISYAFKRWLKEGEKMPLPSQIGGLAMSRRKQKREMQEAPAQQAPRHHNPNVVPWYGKTWSEIKDQGYMPQLEQHLIELTAEKGAEKASDYVKYLKTSKNDLCSSS